MRRRDRRARLGSVVCAGSATSTSVPGRPQPRIDDMTQPPNGDDPQPQYPRQELLPQEVKRGRRHLPLIIATGALVVLVVLVVSALVMVRAVHDDGAQNRADYCAALRTLTYNGNLAQAAQNAAQHTPDELTRVRDLAPSSVRGSWDDLVSLVADLSDGQPNVGQAASALSDLKAIVDDANNNCGMKIQVPF